MALTKDEKATQLTELKDKFKRASSVVFAHYIGMTVADVSDLRNRLKQNKAEMKVAKKTLMRLAAEDLQLPELKDENMPGAVACIFSFDDPLTGAQVAFKFSKDHPQVALIGGIYEGKLISKEEAVAIAKIPGKEALLGMFMSMCIGPLSSFARGLSELAKQKEAPTPVATPTPEPIVETPTPEAPIAQSPAAEAPAVSEAPAAAETPEPETPQA